MVLLSQRHEEMKGEKKIQFDATEKLDNDMFMRLINMINMMMRQTNQWLITVILPNVCL